MVTTLPFVIWMMLTFIDEVPYTLEHAARMMGAGRMTVLLAASCCRWSRPAWSSRSCSSSS